MKKQFILTMILFTILSFRVFADNSKIELRSGATLDDINFAHVIDKYKLVGKYKLVENNHTSRSCDSTLYVSFQYSFPTARAFFKNGKLTHTIPSLRVSSIAPEEYFEEYANFRFNIEFYKPNREVYTFVHGRHNTLYFPTKFGYVPDTLVEHVETMEENDNGQLVLVKHSLITTRRIILPNKKIASRKDTLIMDPNTASMEVFREVVGMSADKITSTLNCQYRKVN